jgi:DNA-binding transcriptional MerR regulator
LRQIEFQLEKFIEFAKKEERIEVARKLQISLDKVREIMDLKGTPELEDVFLDLLEKEIEAVFEKGEYGL